jgi:ankyrin repeat protein
MGSDINAQIETNRNTALTLACFQGRHEVVSLLLDRKANVEHRAKVMNLMISNLIIHIIGNNDKHILFRFSHNYAQYRYQLILRKH